MARAPPARRFYAPYVDCGKTLVINAGVSTRGNSDLSFCSHASHNWLSQTTFFPNCANPSVAVGVEEVAGTATRGAVSYRCRPTKTLCLKSKRRSHRQTTPARRATLAAARDATYSNSVRPRPAAQRHKSPTRARDVLMDRPPEAIACATRPIRPSAAARRPTPTTERSQPPHPRVTRDVIPARAAGSWESPCRARSHTLGRHKPTDKLS
ncbi:hypothetical protein EVAR_94696_1 [Eumeta japonica]|uniref:Uncharacterized protein n=1 Tax=Eumeta variegata TaxID=151549 RepID=A0A4C1UWX9_EUMVA|nr:hypothetical protein EVAR_94696_1 [Eumeta japonica]